jgi:hypothetical protein
MNILERYVFSLTNLSLSDKKIFQKEIKDFIDKNPPPFDSKIIDSKIEVHFNLDEYFKSNLPKMINGSSIASKLPQFFDVIDH